MRVFKKHNVERSTDSEAKAEALKKAGFEEITNGVEDPKDECKDLSKMKVDELKAFAAEMQIEGIESLNKAELVAVLKEAMAND